MRTLSASILLVFASFVLLFGPAAAQQPTEPDANFIVLNSADSTVSLLQVRDRGSKLVKTLPVANNPRGVAVGPDGTRAYVVNSGDGSLREKGQGVVTVLDLRTLTVITTITHPDFHFPLGIAATRDGQKLYVTTLHHEAVFVISTSTNQVLKKIPTSRRSPFMIAMSPDGQRAYVTHPLEPGYVTILDTATDSIVTTIEGLGFEAQGVAVTRDGKTLLVTNYDDGTLSFIDTGMNRVVRTIGVGKNPIRVAVSPDGRFAFTSDMHGDTVSVVDLRDDRRQLVKQIPTGRQPFEMVFNDRGFLYVGNYAGDTITVIDTALMDAVGQIPVGKSPVGVCFLK